MVAFINLNSYGVSNTEQTWVPQCLNTVDVSKTCQLAGSSIELPVKSAVLPHN